MCFCINSCMHACMGVYMCGDEQMNKMSPEHGISQTRRGFIEE